MKEKSSNRPCFHMMVGGLWFVFFIKANLFVFTSFIMSLIDLTAKQWLYSLA